MRLDFQPHIRSRREKTEQLLGGMLRLGNSNGCMSPKSMRALYTGAIRPTFTCGSDVWKGPHTNRNTATMERVEYLAPPKITGAATAVLRSS